MNQLEQGAQYLNCVKEEPRVVWFWQIVKGDFCIMIVIRLLI